MKAALASGRRFPTAWTSPLAVWVIDDLGLVFYGGEPFTEIALELAARSPLGETLLLPMANGSDGYEPYTNCRTNRLAPGLRPLPYAIGAGGALIDAALHGIHSVIDADLRATVDEMESAILRNRTSRGPVSL